MYIKGNEYTLLKYTERHVKHSIESNNLWIGFMNSLSLNGVKEIAT